MTPGHAQRKLEKAAARLLQLRDDFCRQRGFGGINRALLDADRCAIALVAAARVDRLGDGEHLAENLRCPFVQRDLLAVTQQAKLRITPAFRRAGVVVADFVELVIAELRTVFEKTIDQESLDEAHRVLVDPRRIEHVDVE